MKVSEVKFARKVSDGNYGSAEASVTVNLAVDEGEALTPRGVGEISKAQALARYLVNEQLKLQQESLDQDIWGSYI